MTPAINPQTASNVAYRFEDQRYSVSDEYGDHAYTTHTIKLLVFPIIHYTKCGYWIGLNYSHYPTQPYTYKEPKHPDDCMVHTCGKRFVNLQTNKKFALPTIAEAAESYRARKKRQMQIYQARISGATNHLVALECFLNRQKVPA